MRMLARKPLQNAAIAAACVWFGLETSAIAQLRTGRGERVLYEVEDSEVAYENDVVVASEPVARPRRTQSSQAGVVREARPSIVDNSRVARASSNQRISLANRDSNVTPSVYRPSNHRHSHVVPAACPDCQMEHANVDGPIATDAYFESGMTEYAGSGAIGCDDFACDSIGCCPMPDGCLTLGNGLILSWIERAYVRIEGTSFWQTSLAVPGLITTGPATADPNNFSPNQFLFGGGVLNGDPFSGFRISVGSWFDDCHDLGFFVQYLDSDTLSTSFVGDQTTNSVIARRFFDENGAAQDQIVVYPVTSVLTTGANGSINASLTSNVRGFEALLKKRWAENCAARWDLIGGYRNLEFGENLSLISSTQTGTVGLDVRDTFDTSNTFHGGTLGISRFGRLGNWSLESSFQLGLGNLERTVTIAGFRRTTVSGTPPTSFEEAQGLLARNTNSGTFNDDTFVVVPEVGLTLGYRVTYALDFTIGYSLINLPKVARAPDQLDPELQSNLSNPLVGPARPLFSLTEQNLSLHSLNIGGQWRY